MIYTREELDQIAEAEEDRKRVERAEKEKPATEDRWTTINLLENSSVRKSEVPERYHHSWDSYFREKKRNLIGQAEYSKLYRFLITRGILTENF